MIFIACNTILFFPLGDAIVCDAGVFTGEWGRNFWGAGVLFSRGTLLFAWGLTLLDKGQQKFDEFIKKLSSLNSVHDEKVLAGPGQIPGEVAAGSKMIFFAMLGNSGKLRKYKCFLPYLKPSAYCIKGFNYIFLLCN